MARRSMLRASDSDRESVAERLRNATAEGRLLAEELEERLEMVFSARTYGDLDAVVSDLPARSDDRPRAPLWVKATLALAIVVAMVAVLAVAALILVGLASAWVFWMVLAWMFFGRRMGGCGRHWGYSRYSIRQAYRPRGRTRIPRGGSASL